MNQRRPRFPAQSPTRQSEMDPRFFRFATSARRALYGNVTRPAQLPVGPSHVKRDSNRPQLCTFAICHAHLEAGLIAIRRATGVSGDQPPRSKSVSPRNPMIPCAASGL